MLAGALTPVSALLVSVAILLAGNGLQGTLLPVRAQMESFSTLSIGVLGSAYFLGFAAGCVFGPRVVQRAGHIRAFTAMAAIASAAPLAHALAMEPLAWWLLRAITGFCFAVLYIVIESWLNERSSRETRGAVLAVYLVINMTLITAGQMLLALYDPGDFAVFAVASILVSLAAVPVALTGASAPAPVEVVHVRVTRLLRISPVGFIGCLAIGLANGSFWSLGPVFAERTGLDVTGVAVLMSVIVIGGAIGQWPIGRLSDLVDRRLVVVAASLVSCGLAMVLVYMDGAPATWLYALGALWGVFAFPLYAVAVAHTNDHADMGDYVEISSGLLLVYGAGAVVGPLLASAAMQAAGASGLFMFTAAVHLALAVFSAVRMRIREAAPVEEHVAFGEALQAAMTVSPTFELEAIEEAGHEQAEAQHAAEQAAVEQAVEPPPGDAPAPAAGSAAAAPDSGEPDSGEPDRGEPDRGAGGRGRAGSDEP